MSELRKDASFVEGVLRKLFSEDVDIVVLFNFFSVFLFIVGDSDGQLYQLIQLGLVF